MFNNQQSFQTPLFVFQVGESSFVTVRINLEDNIISFFSLVTVKIS